jgi:hypothetical protein
MAGTTAARTHHSGTDRVGSSVARAREANESMMRFTQSICGGGGGRQGRVISRATSLPDTRGAGVLDHHRAREEA